MHTTNNKTSDVAVFIKDLEISAKKILKDANKKKMDARRLEQSLLSKGHTKNDGKDVSKFGSVLVKDKEALGFTSKKIQDLSSDFDSSNFLTKNQNQNQNQSTQVLHYSVPRMLVSMANDTTDLTENQMLRSLSAGTTTSMLNPIKSRDITSPSSQSLKPISKEAIIKRNKLLEKIEASPFLSSSMSSVDILLASNKKKSTNSVKENTQPVKETNWVLRMKATDILSGKQHSNASKIMMEAQHRGKGVQTSFEAQGPVDWSSAALRLKYRGEREREIAWNTWRMANSYSQQALEDDDVVLPVAVVDRHPICVLFFKCIREGNIDSQKRSQARHRMKRFVQDVQEIWLTNLSHLREFQINTTAASEEDEGYTYTDRESTTKAEGGVEGSGGYIEGLDDRRDKKAISAMSSQIQSISTKRAHRKAFHSTRMPDPNVTLDFDIRVAPCLPEVPPPPAILETLVDGMNIKILTFQDLSNNSSSHGSRPRTSISSTGTQTSSRTPVLFIHRMMFLNAQGVWEILWRISIISRSNASVSYLTAHEADVRLHVAQMMRSTMPIFNQYNSGGTSEQIVWRSNRPMSLVWSRGEILDSDIEISLLSPHLIQLKVFLRKHKKWLSRVYSSNRISAFLRVKPSDGGGGSDQLLNGELRDSRCERLAAMLTLAKTSHSTAATATAADHSPIYDNTLIPVSFSLITEWMDENESEVDREAEERKADAEVEDEEEEEPLTEDQATTLAWELTSYIKVYSTNSNATMATLTTPTSTSASAAAADPMSEGHSIVVSGASEGWGERAGGRSGVTQWEELADKIPSMSLLVSGGIHRVGVVPGACEVGKPGLWYINPPLHQPQSADATSCLIDLERTRAAAIFFRNPRYSSSDTVLVNLTLAYDSPCIIDPTVAWENDPVEPPRSQHEEVDGTVPLIVAIPAPLLWKSIISPLELRMAPPVGIFSEVAEYNIDYPAPEKATKPVGSITRTWPEVDEHGFRRRVMVSLLGVDPVLPTHVFGITRVGATPNCTAAHTRNVWHSSLVITDHINRPRSTKDLHYVLKKEFCQGSNDPSSFTVQLRDGQFYSLACSAFRALQQEHDEVLRRRGAFARQLAMEAKIENSEVMLRARDRALEVQTLKKAQRSVERKLAKSTLSEKGWSRRMALSTLAERQGSWERRRDDRSGMFFFHCLDYSSANNSSSEGENFRETCQWHVPAMWEGDPLADEAINSGVDKAFQQPSDTWLPSLSSPGDRNNSSVIGELDDERPDRGVRATQVQRARKGDIVGPDMSLGNLTSTPSSTKKTGPSASTPNTAKAKSSRSRKNTVTSTTSRSKGALPNIEEQSDDDDDEEEGEGEGEGGGEGPMAVEAEEDTEASENRRRDLALLRRLAGSSDDLLALLAGKLGISTDEAKSNDTTTVATSKSGPTTKRTGRSSINTPKESAKTKTPDTTSMMNAPRKLGGATTTTTAAAPGHVSHTRHVDDVGGDDSDDLNEEEFDSDDDIWSDDEHEAGDLYAGGGDIRDQVGSLPQDHSTAAQIRKAKWMEGKAKTEVEENRAADIQRVPFLVLNKAKGEQSPGVLEDDSSADQNIGQKGVRGVGWRRLPRPEIPAKFFSRCTQTKTMGPDERSSNLPNSPLFLAPISPVDACVYHPMAVEIPVESIFISNARLDLERVIATVERNIRREEALAQTLSTAELLERGGDATALMDLEIAKKFQEDQSGAVDRHAQSIEKAILAAKSSDIAQLEDALADGISIDTQDQFGNTLLILAAQQGSKRICKFLLRRGANINAQSKAGNTCLHYCSAYQHTELMAYLKSKGAIDSLLNAAGLTCYEGLSRDAELMPL